MRRHFEGSHLDETEAAGGAVRRVQLVDAKLSAMRVAGHIYQKVAKDSVYQPRGTLFAPRTVQQAESQLQLVHGIGPRFIDPGRLACGPDEHARKEVRKSGM